MFFNHISINQRSYLSLFIEIFFQSMQTDCPIYHHCYKSFMVQNYIEEIKYVFVHLYNANSYEFLTFIQILLSGLLHIITCVYVCIWFSYVWLLLQIFFNIYLCINIRLNICFMCFVCDHNFYCVFTCSYVFIHVNMCLTCSHVFEHVNLCFNTLMCQYIILLTYRH